jgi:hypothetical protein
MTVPDLLSQDHRDQAIFGQLQQLQSQRFDLDLRQVVEDASDEDASGFANSSDGSPQTFKQRRKMLDEALKRIEKAHGDSVARISERLAQAQAPPADAAQSS